MNSAQNSHGRRPGGQHGWRSWQWLVVAGLVLGVLALVTVWLRPGMLPRSEAGNAADNFTTAELAILQPGDIILRRGAGLPSDLLVSLLNDGTGLSHCAMVLEGSPETGWMVIQSVNGSLSAGSVDGVQTQDLADFNRYNLPDCLVVVRPLWDGEERQEALVTARAALAARLPFDNAYDARNHSALYCSELLVWILDLSGWWRPDWLVMQGQFISYRTFLDPAHFKILIDHRKQRDGTGPQSTRLRQPPTSQLSMLRATSATTR